jgi:predicted kinase
VNRLIVTRGLPASGKTTRARTWAAEDPAGRARVNRDDLRSMLHGGWLGIAENEAQVTVIQRTGVLALLGAGIDVIADDTNLRDDVMERWRELADQAGAQLDVWDFTGVPLSECLRRNARRAADEHVPPPVIRDMHARYLHHAGEVRQPERTGCGSEWMCRQETNHCWHPDALIDWWCCMCGAEIDGMPPQKCRACAAREQHATATGSSPDPKPDQP